MTQQQRQQTGTVALYIDLALALSIAFTAGMAWQGLSQVHGELAELRSKQLPERIVSIDERLKSVESSVGRSRAADVQQQRTLNEIRGMLQDADD